MARTAGRTTAETRTLIMEAAEAVFRTRGIQASLDDVAGKAGLSKGGLTYHFASKDKLILAVTEHLLEQFRTQVMQRMDAADMAPGSLTRAYIKTSLDTSGDEALIREKMSLMVQLLSFPGVLDVTTADAEKWRADLAADGLPAAVSTVVIAAADGAGSAPLWGGDLIAGDYPKLEEQLLRLTHPSELWTLLTTAPDE